jgi:hypothetical protein
METGSNILIISLEMVVIFFLNPFLSQQRLSIRLIGASFVMFLIALIFGKEINWIDYRFFIVPFLQITLISVGHFVFNRLFDMSYQINIRGFKLPTESKNDKSEFSEELFRGIYTTIIVMIIFIIFFSLD